MNFGGKVRINRVGFAIICALIILFIIYISPKPLGFKTETVNLRRLLLTSIEAAERGGREIVKVAKEQNLNEKSKGKTNEGVNIPVTDADYKSHCVMYYGITKLFPSIRVISEESDGEKKCENLVPFHIEPRGHLGVHNLPDEEVLASELTVWIDPLDATQEYTEMLHNFVTTMVCVAYKGNPIIGVIHRPFGDEPKTTWAWLNRGKSPNIGFVTDNTNKKKNPIAIVSRSHHGGNIEKLAKSILGENSEIVYAGGSGYKSLEVAIGNATVYLHETGISKWDICAGDAIITSLGGRFTTLNNQYIDYKGDSSGKNLGGVLASMYDHETFAGKLANIVSS